MSRILQIVSVLAILTGALGMPNDLALADKEHSSPDKPHTQGAEPNEQLHTPVDADHSSLLLSEEMDYDPDYYTESEETSEGSPIAATAVDHQTNLPDNQLQETKGDSNQEEVQFLTPSDQSVSHLRPIHLLQETPVSGIEGSINVDDDSNKQPAATKEVEETPNFPRDEKNNSDIKSHEALNSSSADAFKTPNDIAETEKSTPFKLSVVPHCRNRQESYLNPMNFERVLSSESASSTTAKKYSHGTIENESKTMQGIILENSSPKVQSKSAEIVTLPTGDSHSQNVPEVNPISFIEAQRVPSSKRGLSHGPLVVNNNIETHSVLPERVTVPTVQPITTKLPSHDAMENEYKKIQMALLENSPRKVQMKSAEIVSLPTTGDSYSQNVPNVKPMYHVETQTAPSPSRVLSIEPLQVKNNMETHPVLPVRETVRTVQPNTAETSSHAKIENEYKKMQGIIFKNSSPKVQTKSAEIVPLPTGNSQSQNVPDLETIYVIETQTAPSPSGGLSHGPLVVKNNMEMHSVLPVRETVPTVQPSTINLPSHDEMENEFKTIQGALLKNASPNAQVNSSEIVPVPTTGDIHSQNVPDLKTICFIETQTAPSSGGGLSQESLPVKNNVQMHSVLPGREPAPDIMVQSAYDENTKSMTTPERTPKVNHVDLKQFNHFPIYIGKFQTAQANPISNPKTPGRSLQNENDRTSREGVPAKSKVIPHLVIVPPEVPLEASTTESPQGAVVMQEQKMTTADPKTIEISTISAKTSKSEECQVSTGNSQGQLAQTTNKHSLPTYRNTLQKRIGKSKRKFKINKRRRLPQVISQRQLFKSRNGNVHEKRFNDYSQTPEDVYKNHKAQSRISQAPDGHMKVAPVSKTVGHYSSITPALITPSYLNGSTLRDSASNISQVSGEDEIYKSDLGGNDTSRVEQRTPHIIKLYSFPTAPQVSNAVTVPPTVKQLFPTEETQGKEVIGSELKSSSIFHQIAVHSPADLSQFTPTHPSKSSEILPQSQTLLNPDGQAPSPYEAKPKEIIHKQPFTMLQSQNMEPICVVPSSIISHETVDISPADFSRKFNSTPSTQSTELPNHTQFKTLFKEEDITEQPLVMARSNTQQENVNIAPAVLTQTKTPTPTIQTSHTPYVQPHSESEGLTKTASNTRDVFKQEPAIAHTIPSKELSINSQETVQSTSVIPSWHATNPITTLSQQSDQATVPNQQIHQGTESSTYQHPYYQTLQSQTATFTKPSTQVLNDLPKTFATEQQAVVLAPTFNSETIKPVELKTMEFNPSHSIPQKPYFQDSRTKELVRNMLTPLGHYVAGSALHFHSKPLPTFESKNSASNAPKSAANEQSQLLTAEMIGQGEASASHTSQLGNSLQRHAQDKHDESLHLSNAGLQDLYPVNQVMLNRNPTVPIAITKDISLPSESAGELNFSGVKERIMPQSNQIDVFQSQHPIYSLQGVHKTANQETLTAAKEKLMTSSVTSNENRQYMVKDQSIVSPHVTSDFFTEPRSNSWPPSEISQQPTIVDLVNNYQFAQPSAPVVPMKSMYLPWINPQNYQPTVPIVSS